MTPEAALDFVKRILGSGAKGHFEIAFVPDEDDASPSPGGDRARELARARQQRYRDSKRNVTVTSRNVTEPSSPLDPSHRDLVSDLEQNKQDSGKEGIREAGARGDDGADRNVTVTSRVTSRVTRRKRAPRKPVELPCDWSPPAELVSALAIRFSVPETRIVAEVPDFVRYWTVERAGTVRADWDGTFRKRIEMLAVNGTLFAGPRPLRPRDIRPESNGVDPFKPARRP